MKPLQNNSSQCLRFTACFILSSLIVSGCARKPWGDPISEEYAKELKGRVELLRLARQQCPVQWDANIEVDYHTALDEKKFAGYILVKHPSSLKFIASNPLGQPLLALTSNSKQFQLVDIPNSQYTHGSTLKFALLNNVPEEFISGEWGNWLAARMSDSDSTQSSIYTDQDPQKFWYTESIDNRITTSYLIDTSTMLIRESLLWGNKGKVLAAFSYDDYKSNGTCLQPAKITIDQLSFGASIHLNLKDIQPVDHSETKDFILTVPSYYFNRYLP